MIHTAMYADKRKTNDIKITNDTVIAIGNNETETNVVPARCLQAFTATII